MQAPPPSELTDVLAQELYAELKGLAATLRRHHRVGDTLNTTALVCEAYLKLRGSSQWESRQHFMRVAASAMRQVLVDEARYWLSEKRQDARGAVPIDTIEEPGAAVSDEFLVALDRALQELAAFSPRLAQLVECRYFAGYSEEEITDVLGVTERTLRRDWIKAKAWLYERVGQPI